MNQQYKIHKDPRFPATSQPQMKGRTFLDAGYVYTPYVPLQVSPTILGVDPQVALQKQLRKAGLKTVSKEFSSRKGIMSRYGDKMVKPEFFGQVSVLEGKP
jgi:hypothetical protein